MAIKIKPWKSGLQQGPSRLVERMRWTDWVTAFTLFLAMSQLAGKIDRRAWVTQSKWRPSSEGTPSLPLHKVVYPLCLIFTHWPSQLSPTPFIAASAMFMNYLLKWLHHSLLCTTSPAGHCGMPFAPWRSAPLYGLDGFV